MDLITTHLNADFDGLASMVAARKLYPGSTLVLPGGAQEHVRSFLAVHDVGLTKLKQLDLSQVTRLVLVDTHEPERIGSLKELYTDPNVSVHIYDHHADGQQQPARPTSCKDDFRLIQLVGATTTILIERLREGQFILTPFEASVLALGLYEETGSLAYTSTTPRDLEAAAVLLRAGADLNLISDTLRSHLDPDQIALLNDLLQASETYYLDGRKILLATSSYDRYRGDLAEVVHKLAELEGLDAVVAAIAMKEKVEFIGRSRRPEINVARIARAFGGGGHAVAASASIKGQTLVEVKERLAQLLTERYRPTLLARDVMTTPVRSIRENTTVAEAETCLTKYEVNVLPILDSRQRYMGLISREIVQKALFHQLADALVLTLMQTDAYIATPKTPFHDIENHMLERNQRFVPVLKDDEVVGVITRTDLLRTLHDDVLMAARARAKGTEPPPFAYRRNLHRLLRDRIPEQVFQVLKQAGDLAERTSEPAFVVGGFVRDLLLGRPNLDLDLVIEGDGIAYAQTLARAAKGTVKIHDRFGTAIVIFPDGFKLDVATARTEYYEYPTALPTVERSSIKKDLYRRDFTINTLAIRLNTSRFGELIDFFGGQRDLNEKTIRVLHSLSFVEDPTRVFRAIRFEQRYGFRLGRETLALIKGAVKMDLFRRLSSARLCAELVLLLSEEEPRKIMTRLGELDLLRFIHPALKWSNRLDALLKAAQEVLSWYKLGSLNWLDRQVSVEGASSISTPGRMDGWLVYFMVLMEVMPGKAVEETLRRLKLLERHAKKTRVGRYSSRTLLQRLTRRPSLRPAETYRVLAGLSDETLLFLMAKTRSESVKRQISAYFTTHSHMKPALTGTDLKALGLRPGPIFKKILSRLLDARIDGEVQTEADERDLVRRIIESGI